MADADAGIASNWEAAERFRPTADHLPVLIWIAGTDKLCTWFNRGWLEFVGRAMEQEIGNGWAENVHPDDFDRCLEIYVTSFDARVPFRMEYRLRRHDGVYCWILDEGMPLHDEGGTFAGYIGCCLDISDQQRVKADLEKSLERERRVTRTLQAAFLPPYLPEVEGAEFQACYRPAEREALLGGDWYDVFVLRDGRIALSIGDVFGHGLEASGAMVRLRETLRAVTGFIDNDPGLILQLADRAFQASHPGGIASALFAIYDPSTRRMLTANAGHPPPVLVRNGTTMLLPCGDAPVGVVGDSTFAVHETVLEKGDAFVMYTDGLVESDRDAIDGERRLLDALATEPLKADELVTRLTANKQHDDVAVLTFSLIAPPAQPSWRFQADDASSAEHARDAFVAHLRQQGLDAEALGAAALVFGELVANVVRHAPGPIEIELQREDDTLVLAARDRGPAFRPDASLPADVFSEGGRGLFLIAQHAEPPRVASRSGGGNDVRVRIPIRYATHAAPERGTPAIASSRSTSST
jgi:PAS domain S-box-containing protein